jgi:hypothetical protein
MLLKPNLLQVRKILWRLVSRLPADIRLLVMALVIVPKKFENNHFLRHVLFIKEIKNMEV